MDKAFGPRIVCNRAMMEWLSANRPDWNASEWIDDQAEFTGDAAEWSAYNTLNLPQTQPAETMAHAETIISTEHTPPLVKSKDRELLYWQPQDWKTPGNEALTMSQLGSIVPYWVAASECNRAGARASLSHGSKVFSLTVDNCWRL